MSTSSHSEKKEGSEVALTESLSNRRAGYFNRPHSGLQDIVLAVMANPEGSKGGRQLKTTQHSLEVPKAPLRLQRPLKNPMTI